MSGRSVAGDLFLQFALLGLISIGGIIAVIPEMQIAVVGRGWMDERTFVNLFALAQAAPGPNVVVVALVGWHVAGGLGALVAMLGVCAPTFLLTFAAASGWSRLSAFGWVKLVERGLAPVTIGLVGATGLLVGKTAATGPATWVLVLATAALVAINRTSPHLVLAVGAAAGLAGLV
jgi:chromate transporter